MIAIRSASPGDVAAIAGLTARRRETYEQYQPVFWRRAAVTEEARRRGAAQVVVVCGHADEAKREALRLSGLSIASEWWNGLLELDPDLFEAYLDFSGVPWTTGVLEPKVKELVYIAFDASATHLYEPGLNPHMRNALGHGATAEEITEVLAVVSVVGIHAVTEAAPILQEELRRTAP